MVTKKILSKVSYHAVYDESILDALMYARQNGFAGVQIAVESPHLSFESLPENGVERVASYCRTNGLYLNIHAPDNALSLFQCSETLKKGVLQYWRSLFRFALRVSASLVTVHIGSITGFRTDSVPEETIPSSDLPLYQKAFMDNLGTLLELAGSRLLVCVENYGWDDSTSVLLESFLRSRRLALCWDLAKTWRKPQTESFFWEHLSVVRQIHLHDVRRQTDGTVSTHCVIGSGELDFRPYLDRLSTADVNDYCIEVRPREKAKESLEAIKLLLKTG